MIPYYFDLPSLEIPKEIFKIPYVQHPSDFMSPTGKGQGGTTFQYRAVPTEWYKLVKEHLDKKVNLKFGAITLLNTEPDGSSPWHAEGPNLFGRQCALNFMLVGDHENSYVQWASRGDEDILTLSFSNFDKAFFEMSKILNLNSELIRRLAIGLPIVPSPMKAIFGIYSSKMYGVLFFSLFGKPP